MARTLEDARAVVSELSEEDRQVLAEEIIEARWTPEWRSAWAAEALRRHQRIESGEDQELSLEEFFGDRV